MSGTDVITLVEEATIHTFKTMASVDLLAGKARPVSSMSVFFNMISSCISLEGSHLKGVMLLSIHPEAFRKILSSMIGEEVSVEENLSLTAELLNMIHGRIKTKFVEQNKQLLMARPRVLNGNNELEAVHNGEAQSVPFVMDEKHGFFITVISQEEAS